MVQPMALDLFQPVSFDCVGPSGGPISSPHPTLVRLCCSDDTLLKLLYSNGFPTSGRYSHPSSALCSCSCTGV